MPRKTSFYLSDEDDALLRAEMDRGVPLKEIMRRGIGATAPDEALVKAAAEAVAERVEVALGNLRANVTQDVLEEVRQVAREIIADAVREALRQGGGGY